MGVPPPALVAGVHFGEGIVAAGLAVVTLAFGGNDWNTYGPAMVFLAVAVAHLAFGYWETTIARSEVART